MPIPLAAILSAVQLGQVALNTIASFSSIGGSSSALAKTNSAVQDAARVVQAVAPLIQQFASGADVTEDDVRQSFARVGASFDELDELIAQKKAQQS